jgi:hypothetical protein
VYTGFRWENLREGDHLKDPYVDGRIILKLNMRSGCGIDLIDLAEDRDRWRLLRMR